MMSGKGLLSEERISELTCELIDKYGKQDSVAVVYSAIRQAVAEAGEEAAKVAESCAQCSEEECTSIVAAAIRRRVGR
jgi:hypothetical protein